MNADDRVLEEIRKLAEGAGNRTSKAKQVAELIRARGGYRWVGLYDAGAEEIAVIAWSGPGAPETGGPMHPRFPVTQGLCGAAVRARAPVVVGDVTKDPRYLTTFGSTRSEMIVPVLDAATGAARGLIDVESERVEAFTEDDRRFLEKCARLLAPLVA